MFTPRRARSSRRPQPAISASSNKTATGVVFTAASSGRPYFTLHTAQVVVSYAPDVFGGTRRQVESLRQRLSFSGFSSKRPT